MIKKIKADIEIDKMVCELEGYNFTEYLDSLQDVVSSYYNGWRYEIEAECER